MVKRRRAKCVVYGERRASAGVMVERRCARGRIEEGDAGSRHAAMLQRAKAPCREGVRRETRTQLYVPCFMLKGRRKEELSKQRSV